MGRRVYTDIEIRGEVFATAAEAAARFGVSEGQIRAAVRRGRLDAVGTRAAERAVVIRGVTYPNFSAAGRALGVHPNTVRAAYRNGTLHRVGTGRVGPEPMPVRIAGRDFADVFAAARAFRCKPATVYAAICDGDPDRIARAPVYNPWKSKPFSVGGLNFPSMRAASRALGFADEDYVAKVVKRGSKRGMQRIVAAAMAVAARRDAAARKARGVAA